MKRNRAATSARILDATAGLMAEAGLPGLGINAVAEAAGCDKVLIYRYFGSLEGILEALLSRLERVLDGRLLEVGRDRKAKAAQAASPYEAEVTGKVMKAVLPWIEAVGGDRLLWRVALAGSNLERNVLTQRLEELRNDFLADRLPEPARQQLATDLVTGWLIRLPPPADWSPLWTGSAGGPAGNPPLRQHSPHTRKPTTTPSSASPTESPGPAVDPVSDELPVELL